MIKPYYDIIEPILLANGLEHEEAVKIAALCDFALRQEVVFIAADILGGGKEAVAYDEDGRAVITTRFVTPTKVYVPPQRLLGNEGEEYDDFDFEDDDFDFEDDDEELEAEG